MLTLEGKGKLAVLLLGTRPPYRASQSPRIRRIIETTGLASDVRDTPAAQILIERRGVLEHGVHVCDAADVPRADVLIERRGPEEHVAHVRDVADVPRTDVPIEPRGAVEHLAHVRDVTGACGRRVAFGDLSFRSLGVYNAAHFACLAHIGSRAYDGHAVRCEVERLNDRYTRSRTE